MHPEHRALLSRLDEHALVDAPVPSGNDSYTSSGRPYLRVPVPQRRLVSRRWLAQHRALSAAEVLAVVESVVAGTTHEEKTLAAYLLAGHPEARAAATPVDVRRWIDQLHGWAEIDAWCHNVFTVDDLVARWDDWTVLVEELAGSADVDAKRAALVLLVGPVRSTDDPRVRDLACSTVDELRADRDPMITKAVSWLLRSVAVRHPDAVASYLDANQATLPAIAIRETRATLRSGTKRS